VRILREKVFKTRDTDRPIDDVTNEWLPQWRYGQAWPSSVQTLFRWGRNCLHEFLGNLYSGNYVINFVRIVRVLQKTLWKTFQSRFWTHCISSKIRVKNEMIVINARSDSRSNPVTRRHIHGAADASTCRPAVWWWRHCHVIIIIIVIIVAMAGGTCWPSVRRVAWQLVCAAGTDWWSSLVAD